MKKYEFHTKRLITKKQEKAYHLCHQDFEGLSTEEAAERLGISVRAVNRTLERLEKIAPQLFPILKRESAEAWGLWYEGGLSCLEIAERMGTTESAVIQQLQHVKEKMGHTHIDTNKRYRPPSLDTLEIDTVIVKKF